jgi:hypothetical protein
MASVQLRSSLRRDAAWLSIGETWLEVKIIPTVVAGVRGFN